MVKASKSGRTMNPTDAARKQARKKEIARNKLERDLQRATPKDVSEISKRLEELIEEEEHEKVKGKPLSKQLHIRRKVLQDAMKLAVAKEREANLKEKFGDEGVRTTPHGHGVPQRRAEDSVYYHPVNNPMGMPPPGRPQRYKDDVDLMDPAKADEVEAALRARMRAQPEAAARSSDAGEGTILPPPDHPPPGILPPPDGPPPGMSMLPAGVLPPPSDAPPGVILPPPTAPPPGMLGAPLAPPPVPPPGLPHGALPPPVGLPPGVLPPGAIMADMSGAPQVTAAKPVETVIEGAATALRTIPAQQDSKLTSMVPAALRAKRHKEQAVKKNVHVEVHGKDRGFGLAPSSVAGKASEVQDSALDAFMSEIANL